MGNCDIFGINDWHRDWNHLREQQTIYTAFFFPKELWGEPALGFIRFYSINEYSPDYVIGICLQLMCTATFHEPWEPWRQQLAFKKISFPPFLCSHTKCYWQNANGTLKFVATTKNDEQKTRKVGPLNSLPFKTSLEGTMVTIFLQ